VLKSRAEVPDGRRAQPLAGSPTRKEIWKAGGVHSASMTNRINRTESEPHSQTDLGVLMCIRITRGRQSEIAAVSVSRFRILFANLLRFVAAERVISRSLRQ